MSYLWHVHAIVFYLRTVEGSPRPDIPPRGTLLRSSNQNTSSPSLTLTNSPVRDLLSQSGLVPTTISPFMDTLTQPAIHSPSCTLSHSPTPWCTMSGYPFFPFRLGWLVVSRLHCPVFINATSSSLRGRHSHSMLRNPRSRPWRWVHTQEYLFHTYLLIHTQPYIYTRIDVNVIRKEAAAVAKYLFGYSPSITSVSLPFIFDSKFSGLLCYIQWSFLICYLITRISLVTFLTSFASPNSFLLSLLLLTQKKVAVDEEYWRASALLREQTALRICHWRWENNMFDIVLYVNRLLFLLNFEDRSYNLYCLHRHIFMFIVLQPIYSSLSLSLYIYIHICV